MRPHLAVLALSGILLGACGSGDGGSEACGPVIVEDLDPASSQHVTAGTEVVYLTEPPTSGPHAMLPVEAGIRAEPLHPTVQVGVLEQGRVVVQHQTLPAAEVEALEVLVASDVVIAPAPDLPAPVVATAWRHKLECDQIDVGALRRFVTEFTGAVTGH